MTPGRFPGACFTLTYVGFRGGIALLFKLIGTIESVLCEVFRSTKGDPYSRLASLALPSLLLDSQFLFTFRSL